MVKTNKAREVTSQHLPGFRFGGTGPSAQWTFLLVGLPPATAERQGMQAHVRPEEAAVVPSVEASSAGERLDAALAADQAHRAQLQAKWEARYEQARRRAATVEWCAWAVAQAGMGISGLGVVAEGVTKETPALFFPGWIGLVILGLALLLVGMLLGMVCPALQAVPRKLIVLAAQQDNAELKLEGTGRTPGSRSSWR